MRNPYPLVLSVALPILLGVLFLYSSTWQINEDWEFVRAGSLEVHGLEGARVFIDEKRIGTIDSSGTLTVRKVLPGTRTVLVAVDEKWPWTKKVAITSDTTSEVTPFFVALTPNARVLKESDSQYQTAVGMLQNITLPSPSTPLTSPDGTIEAYVRGNTLGAIWRGATSTIPHYFCKMRECGPIDILTTPQGGIRGVSFYDGRSDALIVAASNGIFAIDVNPEGTQNFQPFYRGSDPDFVTHDDHTLYIRDGSFIIELNY